MASLKSIRRIAIAAALLLGNVRVAAAAPSPTPPASADVQLQRSAELGRRHFEHGRYQEAIAEFRRAYELKAEPIFLYDIARCYRQLGISDRALFFYERYQAAAPDAPNRDELDRVIAELNRDLKSNGAAPTPDLPPPDRVLPPSEDTRLAALTFDDRPPAESPQPLWRRWWVWTALGVVAAGAAVAVIGTSRDNGAIPTTELGNKRFY